MQFSPFMSPELQVLRMCLTTTMHRLKSIPRDERGASDLAVTVILVAILAAAAIAIGTIIVIKFTNKANSIPTQ